LAAFRVRFWCATPNVSEKNRNMSDGFPFVAHFPEYDVRRLFRCDPNMPAQEVCDFVVSKMEFLHKNERFMMYCDERRDRTQLFFPEHEVSEKKKKEYCFYP
jgi:hypothetical protein